MRLKERRVGPKRNSEKGFLLTLGKLIHDGSDDHCRGYHTLSTCTTILETTVVVIINNNNS